VTCYRWMSPRSGELACVWWSTQRLSRLQITKVAKTLRAHRLADDFSRPPALAAGRFFARPRTVTLVRESIMFVPRPGDVVPWPTGPALNSINPISRSSAVGDHSGGFEDITSTPTLQRLPRASPAHAPADPTIGTSGISHPRTTTRRGPGEGNCRQAPAAATSPPELATAPEAGRCTGPTYYKRDTRP
jgi:hypothetical protein